MLSCLYTQPMSGRKSVRAPRPRRAPKRSVIARRRLRLPTNVPEIASCSEMLKIADGETNQMYGPEPVALELFKRASLIAANYQQFRITNVKWTFKPQFDTFVANTDAPTALRVPNFYHMIDKAQSLPVTTTIASLRSMGAKPRRFDDKNLVVSYSPGVLSSVQTAAAADVALPKISPWLNTNANPMGAWVASDVFHNGVYYILDTGGLPGDGQYEYGVELEVQFQFRKPLVVVATGDDAPKSKSLLRPDMIEH